MRECREFSSFAQLILKDELNFNVCYYGNCYFYFEIIKEELILNVKMYNIGNTKNNLYHYQSFDQKINCLKNNLEKLINELQKRINLQTIISIRLVII